MADRTLTSHSQLLLGKAPELVRDGAPVPRCRPVVHGFCSEALAYGIDGAVGARSRQPLLRAGTASFVRKAERQLQLHDRMRFEMGHGNRQQRNRLLATVIGKNAADEILGDLRERPLCGRER